MESKNLNQDEIVGKGKGIGIGAKIAIGVTFVVVIAGIVVGVILLCGIGSSNKSSKDRSSSKKVESEVNKADDNAKFDDAINDDEDVVDILTDDSDDSTKDKDNDKDDNADKDSKTKKENEVDDVVMKEVYAAYIKVLQDNETEISELQNRIKGVRGEMIEQPCALQDIDENGIPELFYFSAEDDCIAKLHIYTYVNGQAKEVYYTFYNLNKYTFGLVSAPYFAVWWNDETQHLYIYDYNAGVEAEWFRIKEYQLEGAVLNKIKILDVERKLMDDKTSTYKIDEQLVSEEKGAKEEQEMYSAANKILLYYDHSGSTWKPYDEFDVSTSEKMNYYSMVSYLREKIQNEENSEVTMKDIVEDTFDSVTLPDSLTTGKLHGVVERPYENWSFTFEKEGSFTYNEWGFIGSTGEGDAAEWKVTVDRITQVSDSTYELHISDIENIEAYDFLMYDDTYRKDVEPGECTWPGKNGDTLTVTIPASEGDYYLIDGNDYYFQAHE